MQNVPLIRRAQTLGKGSAAKQVNGIIGAAALADVAAHYLSAE